jgi:autophagy-related protein 13
MAGRLSAQDRQDLEKYTKFLAIKATQIIVQSRLGEKVSTKSKPYSSGTDWVSISNLLGYYFKFMEGLQIYNH